MNERDKIIFELLFDNKCYKNNSPLIGKMMTLGQARNFYKLLKKVLKRDIPGETVDLGCHEGTSSILIQKVLKKMNSVKSLHIFDSFKGLPELDKKDAGAILKKGALNASKLNLIKNFRRFDLKLPIIHEGWFKDTLPKKLPDKICFAHLDGDLYQSILISLDYIYPKLSKGAVVIIDDYCEPSKQLKNYFPGVKKACDNFFQNRKEKVIQLKSGEKPHGFFIKK
jgi:O-methyltransferase